MATASEVKAALDDIAQSIRTERQAMKSAKQRIANGKNNLNAIPSKFSDVLETINGYGTTNAFEAVSKAELAKMTKEFKALVGEADLAVVDLDNRKEF